MSRYLPSLLTPKTSPMKTCTTILLLALLLQGCISIKSPSLDSGYNKLSSAEQGQVVFLSANQQIPDTGKHLIYAVNAQNIFNTIKDTDTTVVYVWSPHCRGENCVSLRVTQQACNKKGYNLLVVAEVYDMAAFNRQKILLANPLLSINHKHYGTDFNLKYPKLFKKELLQGATLPDSTQYGRYYLFCKNKFVTKTEALD